MHKHGEAVVEVREGNAVLSPHGLSDDDLVDIIELIPVFIATYVEEEEGDIHV